MKTAIYLRVSTTEQAQDGYGLEAQREQCLAMATVKGWNVIQEFIDEGISGTKDTSQRPGLNSLIQSVCEGEIEAVIVAKIDRLGRSTKLVLQLVEMLDECRAELVSCKESLDTSTASGRFVMRMFASLAELERDNIVERTTEGRNQRGLVDGERGGRVPLGYLRTEKGIIKDNERVEDVKLIFDLRVAGLTFERIAEEINCLSIKTARGKQWHASSVREVIINEDKYKGGYRWKSQVKWPVILGG